MTVNVVQYRADEWFSAWIRIPVFCISERSWIDAAISFAGAPPNQILNQPVAGPVVLENRRDFLRSGMRTPGADFEWIRSDRGFKILPAKSEAPPVIWVGKDEDLH